MVVWAPIILGIIAVIYLVWYYRPTVVTVTEG